MKKKILITLIAVCTMLFALSMINASAATAFAKKLKDYALSGGKLYNNLGVRHRDLIGTESMI